MLSALNDKAAYDLVQILESHLGDHPDSNPYLNFGQLLGYYDVQHLIYKFKNSNKPLFLSVNIQSLSSKFDSLKEILATFEKNKIYIIAVALQEIWALPHPDLLNIPHFNLFSKQRMVGRGGGVGFYIREGLSAKIINELSPFRDKIFECITIQITLNRKKIYLSNFYRSPSNNALDLESFFSEIEQLLSLLHRNDVPYLVFTDSNINLLKLAHCPTAQKYLEIIHSSGFLNGTSKATRIQGESYSLIDQVLCKNEPDGVAFGTIISDLSDHFINFMTFEGTSRQPHKKLIETRDFSINNMREFRSTLNSLGWDNVYSCTNADEAFDSFFETFNDIYQLYFPIITKRFNKNKMKINDFMTNGLLISMQNKKNCTLITLLIKQLITLTPTKHIVITTIKY